MTPLTQASIEEAFKTKAAFKQSLIQFTHDISNGTYDIAHFVEILGFGLTSPTVELRVKSINLLSGVLALLPRDYLTSAQLQYLATFYADRFRDHHNVIPGVIDGMSTLVTMQNLPHETVSILLRSFFGNTTCQSHVRTDRTKLFHIFKYLSEHYAAELIAMEADFMYGIINSIDGERDPRNLDMIFSFMPNFISCFPLLHLSEEMFEVFACYFPIDFHPSNDDPHNITRDSLADKLAKCLVASPEFIEWTMPLALEKLDSELVLAKLDSLELLRQAALKFSPNLFADHFQEVWNALKVCVFPGSDNSDIIKTGLYTLRTILEQSNSVPEVSHNHQIIVLGTILPHLNDVSQRLFNPATAIALVCISGDAQFASEKVLSCLVLKLKATEETEALNDDQRIQIYTIIAQLFKITALRNYLPQLDQVICAQVHVDLIAVLRRDEAVPAEQQNFDLKHAAINVLNECVPTLSELNRSQIYKALVQLITHDTIDLDFKELLGLLGVAHPTELQTYCIDPCMRNFAIFSNTVKRKIYNNFLPLVKQIAFTQILLDLILGNVFKVGTSEDVRLLALQALTDLLSSESQTFVEELQQNNNLIDHLVQLAKVQQHELNVLEQIAVVLSLIMQKLTISEQSAIMSEYLPKLNLQLAADLFVAKGLLGFLHQDLSLDAHFEKLLNELTQLSLHNDNEQLRQVAHHLLCSMVNKVNSKAENCSALAKLLALLKAEIQKGNAKAVDILSWLGKGLIVRGDEEAENIITSLAELLNHPSLAAVASLAFSVICAEFPQLHLPVIRYLYKQKFFHIVLEKFGYQLENYSEHHLTAIVYVLKATPQAVLKLYLEKIGPILFKSLECNQAETLFIALHICTSFIKQQDDYFRTHFNHIIPSCLKLTTFATSMQVRIGALKLLQDITGYPTFVLLPYKTDVVLELLPVLDDPKRLVRYTAVNTRNDWFLVGAPSAAD